MNEEQLETASREVSPYLQRPLRTLSEAKHDKDSALLELVTQDSRVKPRS